jgi:flagellar hook-basal body complex protein FliE
MMDPVRFTSLPVPPGAVAPAPTAPDGAGFAARMQDALANANREQIAADRTAAQLANGEVDTVDAVLALSKADLTLRHLVALRNRVLEAFQEVMRLPL